jgi:hypothetical protein
MPFRVKLRININKISNNLGREFKPLPRDLNEFMTDRAEGISKVKKCAMQHFLSLHKPTALVGLSYGWCTQRFLS